jgi:acylphosphatase
MIISGKVQGVMMRDHLRKNASVLNIKGWVKNKKDGTVEVLAQGNEKDIDKFIDVCKKGSFLALVQNVEMKEIPIEEEHEGFQIRHI